MFTSRWLGALIVILQTSAYFGRRFSMARCQSIQRRHESAVWPMAFRAGRVSGASLARPCAVGLARLYQRGNLLVSFSDNAGLFTGFPALATTRRCALLCQLFCGQKPSTVRPYPSSPAISFLLTLVIISVFGLINRTLNRHLPSHRAENSLASNLIG